MNGIAHAVQSAVEGCGCLFANGNQPTPTVLNDGMGNDVYNLDPGSTITVVESGGDDTIDIADDANPVNATATSDGGTITNIDGAVIISGGAIETYDLTDGDDTFTDLARVGDKSPSKSAEVEPSKHRKGCQRPDLKIFARMVLPGRKEAVFWTPNKSRFKEHVGAAQSRAAGMTTKMRMTVLFAFVGASAVLLAVEQHVFASAESRPNILFCISDDQSYAHTGANGDPVVKTPAFDQIAREGIRFTHAFCDAPSCGPSRSAILTGRPIWALEEAGNIHSTLPAKFATYTEMLQAAGYVIGSTSKAWSPGRLAPGGRTVNPAGVSFKNFAAFLKKKGKDRPFCFWLGSFDPHRPYKRGSGATSGKDPSKVIVPPYLPDHPVVRGDILDYYVEIERFDRKVANALALLKKSGQLDNTIVVVTSDHGMPFPRAKASLYDAGTRVPLAIRWASRIKSPGRVFKGFVNLSDLAPTFLEAAGLKPPAAMSAHSLVNVLTSTKSKPRTRAFIAMERHDGCRKGGKGYPCRAIRTRHFLYILNHQPNRWPAGDPDPAVCARGIPFGEVDRSPTKQLLIDNEDKPAFRRFFKLSFAKRPSEELYDLKNDPGQISNLASRHEYVKTRKRLSEELRQYLIKTMDPRALGLTAPWDYYPYYGFRKNKNWKVDARR